jgi:CRISPR-associated endoribonuclease Cas6
VLSNWLHNEAISFEKRRFRFFTFSRLIGSYRLKEKKIEFSGPVKLYIGTIHKVVLQSLVENLLKSPSVKLGESSCEIQSIEIEPIPTSNGPTLVKTLSPITIYSTLKGEGGKKKTYYYSPFEKDWEGKLLDNLRRKAKALGWDEEKISLLNSAYIRPAKVSKKNLQIVYYRDTVVKAWSGLYEINLPEPFFSLVYDSGLGAKNSQGFGMLQIVRSG